jgi:hypothetical protein
MNLPKTLNMLLLSGFGMTPQSSFECSFQNYLFSTSGLSEMRKIRNVRKLPSPFSRNTPISSSDKTSWSLKTSFWKKNCQINSKTAIKKFSGVGVSMILNLLDNFSSKVMFLNSKKSFQDSRSVYSLRTNLEVSRHFLF